MKEIELIQKYKRSYHGALCSFVPHVVMLSSELYFICHYRDRWYAWAAVPFLSLTLIKNFTIVHDCGHCSYFPSPFVNCALLWILGLFSFANPSWAKQHELHHETNGHLHNNKGVAFNELNFITLSEVKTFSPYGRAFFCFWFHPLFRFFISPIFLFVFYLRLFRTPASIIHNTLLCYFVFLLHANGIFWHYMAATFIFSTATVAAFHNQHTFETSVATVAWNKRDAAMRHTSMILIPAFMTHFTNGIEYHHIHHLCSKIPGYNLKRFHDEYDSKPVKLTLHQCFQNLWLVAYDEAAGKYLTMKETQRALFLASTD